MSTDSESCQSGAVVIDNSDQAGPKIGVRLSPLREATKTDTTDILDLKIYCGRLEVSIRLNESEVQDIRQLLESA